MRSCTLLALVLCAASAWQPQLQKARPVSRADVLRGLLGPAVILVQATPAVAAGQPRVKDETQIEDSLSSLMPSYGDRYKESFGAKEVETKAGTGPPLKKLTEKEKLQAAAAAKKAKKQ